MSRGIVKKSACSPLLGHLGMEVKYILTSTSVLFSSGARVLGSGFSKGRCDGER